jgi:TonB family protein
MSRGAAAGWRCAISIVAATWGVHVFGATAAPVDEPACARLAVEGILPGMTVDEVRAKLGRETSTTEVMRANGARTATAQYQVARAQLTVDYDGLLNHPASVRVDSVRLPMPQTFDGVAELLRRAGNPDAGRDSLVQGLATGPAVWLDSTCGVVLTYFRRNEAWWSEDVNTFLRADRLEAVKRGGTPASDTVATLLAAAAPRTEDGAPSLTMEASAIVAQADPPADGAAAILPDTIPRRVAYVAPVYPPAARRMGLHGAVTLHLLVRDDGHVAASRIVDARPAGQGFEDAALNAAERWRYAPATRDGRPIDSEIDVVVEFR